MRELERVTRGPTLRFRATGDVQIYLKTFLYQSEVIVNKNPLKWLLFGF